jgi:hypothetical protein
MKIICLCLINPVRLHALDQQVGNTIGDHGNVNSTVA